MDAGIASLAATRRAEGGGNWMSPTRPERLRRRLTAGVDKKKNETKPNKTNKQTTPTKSWKKR